MSGDPLGDLERELVAGWRRARAPRPGWRRLRARPLALAAALLVLAGVATAIAVGTRAREATLGPASPLATWPLRGDAAGDRAALDAARRAWPGVAGVRSLAAAASPVGTAVVLTGLRDGRRLVATAVVDGGRARVVDERPAAGLDPAGLAVLVPRGDRRLGIAVAAPGDRVRGLAARPFDAPPVDGEVVTVLLPGGATASNSAAVLDSGAVLRPNYASTAPPPLPVGEARAFFVPGRFTLRNPDGHRVRRFADNDGRTLTISELLTGRGVSARALLAGAGEPQRAMPHGRAPMLKAVTGDRATYAWTARQDTRSYVVAATGAGADAVAGNVAHALTTAGPDAPVRRIAPTGTELGQLEVTADAVSGRLESSLGCGWDRNVQVLRPAAGGGYRQLGHDRSDRRGRFRVALRTPYAGPLQIEVNPRSFNPDGTEEFCPGESFRRR